MIGRTFIGAVAGILLVSCVSVDAKQPAKNETIEGYSATFVAIDNADAETASATRPMSARLHSGDVTALAAAGSTGGFFSAGTDGFLTFQDLSGAGESWQVSDLPIAKVSANPSGELVALYETDGFSAHRVSVWDWAQKRRLYAKRFKDSVTDIHWSAKGTWLIVGTTSIDGFAMFEASTGNAVNRVKAPLGIVTLSATGASETSMMAFGPSGKLLYIDLSKGTLLASYDGPRDVSSPTLLRGNLAIAGMSDGQVVSIDATTGKIIASWPTGPALMASASEDADPTWIEENSDERKYSIRVGPSQSAEFTVPDGSSITTALSFGSNILIGTSSGNIFALEKKADPGVAPSPRAIGGKSIQRIDDIASDGSRLFILSDGATFISAGPGKAPVYAYSGIVGNRCALLNDRLVFWNSAAIAPITLSSFDGDERREIYQPKDGIRSLSIHGTLIAFVEGTSKAVVVDAQKGDVVFSYDGVGLQDAVNIEGNRLAISRSATAKNPNPVTIVNLQTEETVAVQIRAELCYGLRATDESGSKLAGFFVKEGSTPSTELTSFDILNGAYAANSAKTIASYADDDLVATFFVENGRAYTNLGKGSVVGINFDEGTTVRYSRDYALPSKAVAMDRFIAALNSDGSVTWFEKESGSLLSSGAISSDKRWIEQ